MMVYHRYKQNSALVFSDDCLSYKPVGLAFGTLQPSPQASSLLVLLCGTNQSPYL